MNGSRGHPVGRHPDGCPQQPRPRCAAGIRATVCPRPWPNDGLPKGLDGSALAAAADAVGALTMENLAGAIGCVPLERGVSDGALRTLALFVHARRTAVAKRLRDAAELMK